MSVTLAGAANATVTVNGVAEDMVWNIENVTGGSGADVLRGDGLANRLIGGADTLEVRPATTSWLEALATIC